MVCKTHKYANGGQVKCYADGGKVKKPMKPPQTGGKPKRITTPGKPGDSGPGGAHPGRNPPKKMADGGKVAKKEVKKTPKPEMLGSGMAANAGDTLANKRKQQMKDLGL